MNKKVLSAILFSALFAGTGTFTSCIDTDEPAGIEELRGAKAELIRAKVAVEQAKAEYKKAEATKVLAEAAKVQAEAKIEEAKARIKEAKAEAQEALTAEAKAKAEAVVDSIQREMEVAALEHQATLLQKQEALAVAQRSYEIALKQIEIAKALMSEENKVAVSALVAAVEAAQTEVNAALANYQRIQDKVYGIQLQGEIDSTFDAKQAAHDLKYAKIELAAKEATLAKYQSFMEKEAAETADWRAEIEEIADSLEQIEKEYALIELKQTEALYTDAYKAYEDTLLKAKQAVTAEKDTLRDLAITEEVSDTLLWGRYVKSTNPTVYGYKQDVKLTFDAGTSYDVIGKYLAGADYLEAEDSLDYKGILQVLRNEHDSYTTEKAYWLDSIANMDADKKEAASKLATKALENYTKALAAWEDAYDATAWTAEKTKAETAVTAFETAVAGLNLANLNGLTVANYNKVKTAATTLKTALLAYYTAGAKMNMEFNVVALPTYNTSAQITGYTSKTAKAWLEAADGVDNLIAIVANATTGAKYFINEGAEEISVAASGNVAAYKTSKNKAVKAVANKATLKTALETASDIAFGDFENYYAGSTLPNGADQNGYLHNVPTVADVIYVKNTRGLGAEVTKTVGTTEYKYYQNVGLYGFSLLAIDEYTQFEAANHKAIKADLKAAIDKWTALVDGFKADVKKANDDITAAIKVMDAAQKKLDDYANEIKLGFIYEKSDLIIAERELTAIKSALIKAVNAFLPEGTPSYTDAKEFAEWLAGEVKSAEQDVIDEEEKVAKKEMAVKKVEAGIYTNSDALIDAEYELNRVEEELAKAEKALADALAALATAEEIWNAAE